MIATELAARLPAGLLAQVSRPEVDSWEEEVAEPKEVEPIPSEVGGPEEGAEPL